MAQDDNGKLPRSVQTWILGVLLSTVGVGGTFAIAQASSRMDLIESVARNADKKADILESKLQAIEARLCAVDGKVDKIDGKVDRLLERGGGK